MHVEIPYKQMLGESTGRNQRKYRNETQIVAEVLTVLRDSGAQAKTRAFCSANVSSGDQMATYLTRMLDAGLVIVANNGRLKITDKGLDFLKTTEHANSLLQVKA